MNKHMSLRSGVTKRQRQAGVGAAQFHRSLSLGQGQSLNISEPPLPCGKMGMLGTCLVVPWFRL